MRRFDVPFVCCAFGFKIAIELRYLTMCKISSSLGWSNLLELFTVREVFPGGINIHSTSTGLFFFLTVVIVQKKTPLPRGLHYFFWLFTLHCTALLLCVFVLPKQQDIKLGEGHKFEFLTEQSSHIKHVRCFFLNRRLTGKKYSSSDLKTFLLAFQILDETIVLNLHKCFQMKRRPLGV